MIYDSDVWNNMNEETQRYLADRSLKEICPSFTFSVQHRNPGPGWFCNHGFFITDPLQDRVIEDLTDRHALYLADKERVAEKTCGYLGCTVRLWSGYVLCPAHGGPLGGVKAPPPEPEPKDYFKPLTFKWVVLMGLSLGLILLGIGISIAQFI